MKKKIQSDKRLHRLKNRLIPEEESARRLRLIVVFSLLAIFVSLALFYQENTYPVEDVALREVIREDIPARIDFQWVDRDQMEARLRERLDNAPKVYLLDENIGESEQKRLMADIAKVKKILTSGASVDEKEAAVKDIWGKESPDLLKRMTADQLNTLSLIFLNILDAIYQKGIINDRFFLESPTIPVEIRRKNDNFLVEKESLIFRNQAEEFLHSLIRRYLEGERMYSEFTFYVLKNYLRENVYFSEELTVRRAESIKLDYVPETVTIRKGEIIARKGEIVDETVADKIEKMKEKLSKVVFLRLAGFFLTLIFLMAVVFLLLRQEGYWHNIQKVFFWSVINFFFMVSFTVFYLFSGLPLYAFPFLAFIIMDYFLIDLKAALFSLAFWTLLLSVFVPDFRFSALWFLSSLLFLAEPGRFRLRIPTLSTLLKYLAVIMVSLFFIELSIAHSGREALSALIWVPLYVLLSFAGGYLFVYLFERAHNITTEVSLNSLQDWENPLLRQLMSVAPGTYRHSLIVSELSGEAAKAIGGDVLLAQVGGLYHDIGKVKRPDYFIENQMYGPNRHDNLLPLMSVRILKNHVEEGALMARKYGLGRRLIAIIREHHGTSLIKYFYLKNLKDEKHKNIDEKYFRYDGPKPSTKESAIIFLADKVEAVTRLLFNSPFHHVQERISKIFEDALFDRQLENCDLTLRDLNTVKEAFVEYVRGSRHKRIEYPKETGGKE
ncbi:MAG TPA: HDIG domain-containing protein [Candidatus Mcinerneyibacteriales bacterium]|nr:HDIG domain-containing protein [Candidatus Mcinerneyibacteriales bacterium]